MASQNSYVMSHQSIARFLNELLNLSLYYLVGHIKVCIICEANFSVIFQVTPTYQSVATIYICKIIVVIGCSLIHAGVTPFKDIHCMVTTSARSWLYKRVCEASSLVFLCNQQNIQHNNFLPHVCNHSNHSCSNLKPFVFAVCTY